MSLKLKRQKAGNFRITLNFIPNTFIVKNLLSGLPKVAPPLSRRSLFGKALHDPGAQPTSGVFVPAHKIALGLNYVLTREAQGRKHHG